MSAAEERHFREALYLLLEKVRATKAAFYLADKGGGFRLASQYGFTRTDRLPEQYSRTDPLPQTIFENREPRSINDLRHAGRLTELMEASSSTRLLTAPLYVNGRICGFLDVRDKAGREPFLADDVVWVKEVLRRIAMRVRGMPEIAGEEDPAEASSASPRPAQAFRPPSGQRAALAEGSEGGDGSFLPTQADQMLQLVRERLRVGAETGKPPEPPSVPSAREIAHYRVALEALLPLPDVEVAALSRFSPGALNFWFASVRPVSAEAEKALHENVDKGFSRLGTSFPMPAVRTSQSLSSSDPDGPPLGRPEVGAIQSSALLSGPDEALVLSLAFRAGTDPVGRERLRSTHLLVKSSITEIRAADAAREAYRGLVNRLLEPGLKRYPALRAHSFGVGRLARKFAGYLQLGPVELEQITVAAILHDVGLRELSYEELSVKKSLSPTDTKLIREHPAVGALLVGDIRWPYPIAPLIHQHHERWDGAGYPNGLSGSTIAFGARVIHLCEAFDAMTSRTSYRQVLLVPQALDIIVSKAGTQFDPELAPAFRRMVESLKA